jgi:CHAT domain-containing protein
MDFRCAMIFAIAAFVIPIPTIIRAQEEPDEIQESGPRLGEEEARRILAEALPPSATNQQQIEYFQRRERAAFTMGEAMARIDALRRLVELTATPDKPSPYIAYLWRELWRYGNQTEAMEMGETLVHHRGITPEQRIAWTVNLGRDYVNLGNRSRATELLKQAEAEVKATGSTGNLHMLAYTTVATEDLRARLLQGQNDPEGALVAMRRALDASLAEVKRSRSVVGSPRTDLEYDAAIRQRNMVMGTAIWLYFVQGRNEEAEGLARLGLRLSAEERTRGGTVAYWHQKLAQALLGERRFPEAATAANEALTVLRDSSATESSLRIIYTQSILLQALLAMERWADADRLAAEMRAATTGDRTARGMADNPVLQAFLHLKNDRLGQARERIDGVVNHRQRSYGEKNGLTIEARAVRALVLQAQGAERLSLDDYRAVFANVFTPEKSFGDAQPSGVRGFYLPQALRGFLSLVCERYAKDGAATDEELVDLAFRVADRLQLSSVQRSLIDSAARVVAATPELADLVRREQEQRIKSREIMTSLNQALAEDHRLTQEAKQRQAERKAAKEDEKKLAREAAEERERARARQAALKQLRDQLEGLERERGEIQVEIGRRFPEYQFLVNPKPPSLSELSKLLVKDEAFVSIYPFEQGTLVWGLNASGRPAFHVSSLKPVEVRDLVTRLRRTLDLGAASAPNTVAFDSASSHRLFRELLAPVWLALGSPRVLTMATASELAQLPLAVLITLPSEGTFDPAKASWLVRETALNQIATASAFRALRESRQRVKPTMPFFGFGDPLFRSAPASGGNAPGVSLKPERGVQTVTQAAEYEYSSLSPLPETRDEIAAIAKALGADIGKDVRFGAQATRTAALTTDLSNRRVVAFATHGLRPGDLPGLSRPALAMAATTPAESPLLVMDDVLTMKLNADWIVLSACNTASDDGRTQEAFSGLARAFFFSGARSVLATHWAVESLSAQQLVTRTFAHQSANQSASRAECLRQAQLQIMEGKAGDVYAHPFFWAPYAVYGDPIM